MKRMMAVVGLCTAVSVIGKTYTYTIDNGSRHSSTVDLEMKGGQHKKFEIEAGSTKELELSEIVEKVEIETYHGNEKLKASSEVSSDDRVIEISIKGGGAHLDPVFVDVETRPDVSRDMGRDPRGRRYTRGKELS